MHDSAPAEKAEDGNDDVKGVEARLEGQSLVGIECAGDDIDGNPDEPLFQVLMGKRPDAQQTQRGGERVGQRDGGVGERDEQPVDGAPEGGGYCQPRQDEAAGEMTHPQPLPAREGSRCLSVSIFDRSGLGGGKCPLPEAIDGHGEVVELHAAVGIEALLVVEHDAERLHDEAYCPHPGAGTVLEQDVEESESRGGDVEPMVG